MRVNIVKMEVSFWRLLPPPFCEPIKVRDFAKAEKRLSSWSAFCPIPAQVLCQSPDTFSWPRR